MDKKQLIQNHHNWTTLETLYEKQQVISCGQKGESDN